MFLMEFDPWTSLPTELKKIYTNTVSGGVYEPTTFL